jgi:hypothetical protein
MQSFKSIVGCGLMTLLAGSVASGQSRWSMEGTFGGQGVPDVFAGRCGHGTGEQAALDGGVAVGYHTKTHLVFDVGLHYTATPLAYGCSLVLPLYPLSDGTWETRDIVYKSRMASIPVYSSMTHVGLETTNHGMFLRGLLGAGTFWTRDASLLGSIGGAIGFTRGTSRYFIEGESFITRVSATEVHTRFGPTSNGSASLASTSEPIAQRPRWLAVRIGYER